MKAVAVLLFAGCLLAVASAAVPNHPFFTGNQLAETKNVDGRYGYEPDYDYDKQRLFLQVNSLCYNDRIHWPFRSFITGLGCSKDYHYEQNLLDISGNTAGWCLWNEQFQDIDVPGTNFEIEHSFNAICYLKSNSPECHLDQCDNAVLKVEGIAYVDRVVYESEPVDLKETECTDEHKKTTDGEKQLSTREAWAEKEKKAGRQPGAKRKGPGAPGGEEIWVGPAYIHVGIAQTYDSHGKLIGTGTFQYNYPLDWWIAESPAEASGKRVVPYQIKTGINAIKSGEHYHN